jgi:hypothetical protein
VRKKRVLTNKPIGTPSRSSAAQDHVTKKPPGMTSSSSAAQDPVAGDMTVEEPVYAEEVQEEEREEHDLLCEERGCQDDTYLQCCPMCALTAALDGQTEEEKADEEDSEPEELKRWLK